jgi:hypothetical protein
MEKFIVRRLLLMLLTMFLVSVAVFLITEAAPGNVARNVLGIHITPEQEASFLAQTGLDKPWYDRYVSWLIGTDWRAVRKVGMPMRQITTEDGFKEWWAVEEDGTLIQWKLEGEDLMARRRQPDGSVEETVDASPMAVWKRRWTTDGGESRTPRSRSSVSRLLGPGCWRIRSLLRPTGRPSSSNWIASWKSCVGRIKPKRDCSPSWPSLKALWRR